MKTMTLNLSDRDTMILRAALTVLFYKVDDVNSSMADLHIPVKPFEFNEVVTLAKKFDLELSE
jgi:hypothetical protein